MKKFSVVSVFSGAEYFRRLKDEFQSLTKDLSKYHEKFPFDVSICIRCASKNSGIETKRRFRKLENTLGMDLAFFTEDVEPMLRCEQRHLFGHTVFNYVKDSIEKYAKPSIEREALIEDLLNRFTEKGWLNDEVDYSDALDEG